MQTDSKSRLLAKKLRASFDIQDVIAYLQSFRPPNFGKGQKDREMGSTNSEHNKEDELKRYVNELIDQMQF